MPAPGLASSAGARSPRVSTVTSPRPSQPASCSSSARSCAAVSGGAPDDTAEELFAELRQLAGWLGLASITIEPRGDLAPALAALAGPAAALG